MTLEEFNRLYHYDPVSGIITKIGELDRIKSNRSACGSTNKLGYVTIKRHKKLYYAHRLAFLAMTGEMPDGVVDHIDGNPSNNAWNNLRIATRAQNTYNRKRCVNNKSGIKGVFWNQSCCKWQATIKYQGKNINLGLHARIEDAEAAVKLKRQELHGSFSNHG